MKPDIIVLAAGAHLFGSATLFHTMINQLVLDVARLKKKKPSLVVLWKTQQPAGCSATQHPQSPLLWARYKFGKSYQYADFIGRDAFAAQQLAAAGVVIIDMRMVYSRPDDHIGSYPRSTDCMHFCMPGPLDIIPPLFQHALLSARS